MGNVVTWVAIFIMSFSEVYVWSLFYCDKIKFNNIFLYLFLFLMMLFGLVNYFYISVFIRIFIVSILLSLVNWLIFRQKINETLISTLFGQLLLAFSDAIGISFFLFFFKGGLEFVKNNYFGSLIGNVFVCVIFIFISRFKFIKKIYLKLVDVTNNIKYINLVYVGLLLILSINILMALSFYRLNHFYIIFINLILLMIYSFIIYKSVNEKNNNMIIKAENDSLMYSLHQYEDMVDRQRVDNHENKNQLLIIKNMIKKNDKDVLKYIDTIVKDKKEDDEVLYTRVMTIPSGGLQGIIYQKMLTMKDEKILFSLDVSRDVRKINLDDLSMDDNYKLCKIIGVFLDNAIEESNNIKDKCIMISLYVDEDNLVVDISNRFNNEIDIDRIDDEGYSTKGAGHGYGLSLVKKIVSESDIFENDRIVKKDVFKQIIKVKIKNT